MIFVVSVRISGSESSAIVPPDWTLTATHARVAPMLPVGAVSGRRPGGVIDRCVSAGSALLASAPSFVVGALLVAWLSVHLGWFPVAGSDTPRHLVLPVVALALALVPGLAQVMRHGAAEASGSLYVAFARMRGVTPKCAAYFSR